MPISSLADSIGRARQAIELSGLTAPLVGHVGDGNFHLVILVNPDSAEDMDSARDLAAAINKIALSLGGTVTGEHGIGTGKRKYMDAEHGGAWALMRRLKAAVDPDDIMNPGQLV